MAPAQETIICLTIDCNSEPQSVVNWCSRFLRDAGVRATFFLTEARDGTTVAADGHEVALLIKVDSIQEAPEALRNGLRAHPSAQGVRFFAGFLDSRVTQVLRDLGFKYQSNLFIPHHVPPFRQRSLLQFPVILQDLPWVLSNLAPGEDLFEWLLTPGRTYTTLFHAGLLFHNVRSAKDVQVVYEGSYRPDRSESRRGSRDMFLDFMEFCRRRGYRMATCEEATRGLADVRDLREMNWKSTEAIHPTTGQGPADSRN